jgi:rfaE bifunctional protein nucleotidyltransferase chain/domain
MNKLIDLGKLSKISDELRAAGKTVVATNGCFDLLHVGHIRYLQKARTFGDVLIVGVNGDASVRKLKGTARPITDERDRAEILAALECVDLVVIFSDERAVKFLEAASPAVYVKGGDYTPDTLNSEERSILAKVGAKIEIIPFEKGYSTSILIDRLRNCPQ